MICAVDAGSGSTAAGIQAASLGAGRPTTRAAASSLSRYWRASSGETRSSTIRSAYSAATAMARSPKAATVIVPPGGSSRSRYPWVDTVSPSKSAWPPPNSARTAWALSARVVTARRRERPCICSTTRMLDVPSATPTGRWTRAAVDAAPRAMLAGSRTETGIGPTVIGIRSVARPAAVASANASQTNPSPTHRSGYPNRSASTAVRSSSSGATFGRDATTTLMSIAKTNTGRTTQCSPVPTHRGRSFEQLLAPVAVGVRDAGRAGEQRRADVPDVLVQCVLAAQLLLQGDELGRVLHVRDEEQPGVQVTGALVDAVGEGVPPTQQAQPVVVLERGQPDVRVVGDHRGAVRTGGGEVGEVELGLAGQRGAGVLGPADHRLLVGEPVPVPGFDEHPDPPRHQVAAALDPRPPGLIAHPAVLVERVGVVALDVAGAVLEAQQVALGLLVGTGGRGTPEAQLGPPGDSGALAEAGQVADRVEGHRRVVRAGLDADVATGAARIEDLAGQRGQRVERRRPVRGQPEPPVEQGGAEADGHGQPGRRQPDCLSG